MRRADWQRQLVCYLDDVKRRSFGYGQFDCALFVAGAVEAMTGEDYAGLFRNRYDTPRKGLKLLAGHGHASPIDFVAMHFEETLPALAAPGDIVVVVENGDRALGILQGSQIYVVAEQGVSLISRMRAYRAFRVT